MHTRWMVITLVCGAALTACADPRPPLSQPSPPQESPTDDPSEEPSPGPPPAPSPTPYTEFSTFDTSGRPHEVAFRFEYPSGWRVDGEPLDEPKGAWTYSFYRLDWEVYPSTPGCIAEGQVALQIGVRPEMPPDDVPPFPDAEGEMDVGGEQAPFTIAEPGDARLDANRVPGCLMLWAHARMLRGGTFFTFHLSSALDDYEREAELFRRMLRSFEFL